MKILACAAFLRFHSGCQRMLLFVVSDRSIAFHLQLLTSIKDMHTMYGALPHKRRSEWQKYPAGKIRGSCNSCGHSIASKLTSAQRGPPRKAGLSLKTFAMLLFLPPITHTFSSPFLSLSIWLVCNSVFLGRTSEGIPPHTRRVKGVTAKQAEETCSNRGFLCSSKTLTF